MRAFMRFSTIAITLSAAVSLNAFAQDGAPAAATPPAAAPAAAPAPKSPAADFTEADRSAEAIKKAEAVLKAAAEAYKAAPTLAETISLKIDMGAMGARESKMMTAYGEKNSMSLKSDDMGSIVVLDEVAYFLPSQPADKYVEQKVEGSISKTLESMIQLQMPTGALAAREGRADASDPKSMLGWLFQNATIAGFRSADSVDSVLVKSDEGEAVLTFDSKSHLQTGAKALLTPPGAPPGFAVNLNVSIDNKVGPSLDSPIVLDKGTRAKAKDMMELMGVEEPKLKVSAGDVAPVATLKTLDGKDVNLADLKGKVVVIDFWATWCGPCKRGLPLLEEFATSMKSNDKVVVYPVNVWENVQGDERTKAVTDFWTKQKFTMTTLVDPDSKFIDAFGFSGIPAFVVINPEGKIEATHVGFDPKLKETLTAEVEKALGVKK